MRVQSLIICVLSFFFFVSLMIGCGGVADMQDKVPVTTSSNQALKLFKQGRDLQEKLRTQESLQYLEQAVAEDADFAMGYLYLSLAQPSAKEFFESLDKAKVFVDKVSEGERLWILGFEAGVNGNPAKQRELYEKLVKVYPDDERVRTLLGNYYFGQQEWTNAIEEYEKAIIINADFSQPYNQLGYAYRFLEKYDDSEKTFEKYIELIPDDPNPYDSYAELLMKIGKYDASIDNYKKALAINSNFVASHIGIATNLNFKDDHEAARKQLQKLYESALNDGERRAAHFAMTVSYVDEGNLAEALAEQKKMYSLAEKINDSAAMAGDLNTMGNILLEFGNTNEAMDRFEGSLQIMQKSDLSKEQKELAEMGHLFNAAHVALKMRDFALAKTYTEEYKMQAAARKNRFQIWAGHQLAGMTAYAENDFLEAVSKLEKSNLQNPYNIYRLALIHEANGNTAIAEKMFDKVTNFNALNSLAYAFTRKHHKALMTSK